VVVGWNSLTPGLSTQHAFRWQAGVMTSIISR
jgi:uncharacterized membrane protein